MKLYNNGDKKNYYLLILFTLITLCMKDSLSGLLMLLIGFIFWVAMYFLNRSNKPLEFIFTRMAIFSIPFSFINVFSGNYEDFPLSWFNITVILLILIYIFKNLLRRKFRFNYISIASIFMLGFAIAPMLVGNNLINAIEYYINFSITFIFIIMGNSFKYTMSAEDKHQLIHDYITTTKVTALGVITQIIFNSFLGKLFGRYEFLGNYRHAYGFLFSDYSFLSLYLVSGATLLFFSRKNNIKNKIKWIFQIAFLIVVSILTSARTGILAFIVVFSLYTLIRFLHLLRKRSIKSIYIVAINIAIISVGFRIVSMTRGMASFSDSGRSQLNYLALKVFIENPLLGMGLGRSNYIGMLPHNLLFQSLSQGGIIFTIPLATFIVSTLWVSYRKDKIMLPVLLCVFVGSMFIPNVFSSRFLPVLYLLLSLRI